MRLTQYGVGVRHVGSSVVEGDIGLGRGSSAYLSSEGLHGICMLAEEVSRTEERRRYCLTTRQKEKDAICFELVLI